MLYARTGVKLKSIFHGGDQEFGLRPGTENIIAIYKQFAEKKDYE